jgi:hypothetical protein
LFHFLGIKAIGAAVLFLMGLVSRFAFFMVSWGTENKFEAEIDVTGEGDAEGVPRDTPLDVADVVHFLVLEYLGDHIGGGDALCPFGLLEFPESLAVGVGILDSGSGVGDAVMAHVVDPHLIDEL